MFGEDAPPSDQYPLGFVLAIALHGFQLLLGPLTDGASFWFLGISQLLYILPAIALCRYKQRDDLVKGLIVGASVTFLLNASCLTVFHEFWLK